MDPVTIALIYTIGLSFKPSQNFRNSPWRWRSKLEINSNKIKFKRDLNLKRIENKLNQNINFCKSPEKNGIPHDLINKAKKKTNRGKVRFDASIAQ